MKILTSSKDDFLYERIIRLLEQVKLVRGGTDLAYTLRNHKKIRDYCREKQSMEIERIETDYFNPDGSLDNDAIDAFYEKNNPSHIKKIMVY